MRTRSDRARPAWAAGFAVVAAAAAIGAGGGETLAPSADASPRHGAASRAHWGAGWLRGELIVRRAGGPEQLVDLPAGVNVWDALDELRSDPMVRYAVPNWVARGAALPNDPGTSDPPKAGGWQADQWNLLSPELGSQFGISAPDAWEELARLGAPGARGVTVAIVDSGLAYRRQGRRYRPNPDISRRRIVAGRDFVDGDRIPLDLAGHGTHIAGTIGQQTGNGRFLTGIAHRATLMPVRVLDERNNGKAFGIAKGIRWATSHGADVINLSLSFPTCAQVKKSCIHSCDDLVGVCKAVNAALAAGVVVVAAGGNWSGEVSYPARIAAPGLIAVGASTIDGKRAAYSPAGQEIELLAPGGAPAAISCVSKPVGDAIVQVGFKQGRPSRFCLQRRWGTSMATAHVSGVAALVIARARALGQPDPTPAEVEQQLRCSAWPVADGAGGTTVPGTGSGIVDAAKAVAGPCISPPV